MISVKSIFFDDEDHQLLTLVRDVLAGDEQSLRSLPDRHMHPEGIKELAASRGLRMAGATAGLSRAPTDGTPEDRLHALQTLRGEVLSNRADSSSRNTARALIQIMKELVQSLQKSGDTTLEQLRLAHTFRLASTGNPHIIHRELHLRHLLEMPPEWNQFAFDNHVHDATSKGRKSPTHLVLDAWIKGLRKLTVVYYNYLQPKVIAELLKAGQILEMDIQIAVEFSVPFRDKYIRIQWEPQRVYDSIHLLRFLRNSALRQLIREGREVSTWQQHYVFGALNVFNERHRIDLAKKLNCTIEPCSSKAFLAYVGPGQPSLLHLAGYIRSTLPSPQQISLEEIIDNYLLPKRNPELTDPSDPHQQSEKCPVLLRCTLRSLLRRLRKIHPFSLFTLNLANLSPADILELLYAGGGRINHLETFNLKNTSHFYDSGIACTERKQNDGTCLRLFFHLVNDLQQALTRDNAIALKRAIRAIIAEHDEQIAGCRKRVLAGTSPAARLTAMKQRRADLLDILLNIEKFHTFYRHKTLGSRLGSSSTGRAAEHYHGMGLVVTDTLPAQTRRQVQRECDRGQRTLLPVQAKLLRSRHSRKNGESWVDWSLEEFSINFDRKGNVATLGGTGSPENRQRFSRYNCLNTNLKNTLKITIGFIPAFLTFMLTKEWWLLAWFGAPIWFAITGSRNIIQSVLGGGGLRRSPLLPWNSLVSWSRIADSLLFTGFSVPLLDWLVKNVLLAEKMGVTTATNPMLLYAVMGLANGIYISSHNVFRGLPTTAAVGNFFRSILAIPVAVALNSGIAMLLGAFAVPGVDAILQRWAAIISKFASDCVAAIIEGIADRQTNIRARLAACRHIFDHVYAVYSRLDLLLPETDLTKLLNTPEQAAIEIKKVSPKLHRLLIINALDLMYFRLYQPRTLKALEILHKEMSTEEQQILHASQQILRNQLEISQLFINGLVGRDFAAALAFYLKNWQRYLELER